MAECIQYVSGQLPPDFGDWPDQITDKLFAAVELLQRISGKPYILYHAICDFDDDMQQWFVRAIAVAPQGKTIVELVNATKH